MYSKQLPQELPFSVHLPVAGAPAETLTIENAEELGCTNADLIKAIESSEHFDDLYIVSSFISSHPISSHSNAILTRANRALVKMRIFVT